MRVAVNFCQHPVSTRPAPPRAGYSGVRRSLARIARRARAQAITCAGIDKALNWADGSCLAFLDSGEEPTALDGSDLTITDRDGKVIHAEVKTYDAGADLQAHYQAAMEFVRACEQQHADGYLVRQAYVAILELMQAGDGGPRPDNWLSNPTDRPLSGPPA